ncbi:drug:proton antiporter [Rhodobacterales bacterium HKCCE2091]|nr:drug:proton antiporter [Rhodobacterales bacterium HKCCE2091]
MRFALRLALRELRGGLGAFRVFLLCLALGVAAIAGVGLVRMGLEAGLTREAATILGGDAEMRFTYRMAADAERAFMDRIAAEVSETVDFRSMAQADGANALTQVRGVDGVWPLYGSAGLSPEIPVSEALAGDGRLPGAIMDPVLAERLGIAVGDTFRLGVQDFRLSALLTFEPDAGGSGFSLGPRTVVPMDGLAASGLLAPGTLYESNYRLRLPQGADLSALEAEAEGLFADDGLRWRDTRNAAPGIARFVERMGAFLALVGLAGLAVGGVGISASVRAYLDGKVTTIATLRTLGAETRVIFATYLVQVAALTLAGIVLGLVLGTALPVLFRPLIEARLPVPVEFGLWPGPLAQAALYGALTAFLFALWPLARTGEVRAAVLYRDGSAPARRWPRPAVALALVALAAALVGSAVWLSGMPGLALGMSAGIVAALAVLVLSALAVRALAGRARGRVRGRPGLRLALAAIAGPGSEAVPVTLSLGLGLAVLATMGQVDANLRAEIARDLPEIAPSYFFVDIQPDQLPGFLDRTGGDPAVTRVETAANLRGTLTRINGRPAEEVAGPHWVLRGDRGVTYSETAPPAGEILAGDWWPDDYDGPPLMAFAAEEAEEMGIGIGDEITVNVLGRDITATIAALREVDYASAGISFVMSFSENALAGAPRTYLATVYMEGEDTATEAALVGDILDAAPNVTAIRVRDAIDRVTDALEGIAAATTVGAGATLLLGFVVLIGAAAAGEPARVREAAVLKVLGAERGRILGSFALRSAILGAAAGTVAVAAGALGAWAVMRFVMESGYRFEPVSAAAIVAGGAATVLAAGLLFALRPLSVRPAGILRAQD